MLLGLVLFIWGIIGYRVVKTLSPDEEPIPASKPLSFNPKPLVKKDTFSLLANYRDPFLGPLPKNKRKPSKNQVVKKPVQKRNIAYSGSVSQSGSGNSLFFVTIDGHQYMMSIKEEVNGVQLISGNKGDIKVRYNGITESISRSQ